MIPSLILQSCFPLPGLSRGVPHIGRGNFHFYLIKNNKQVEILHYTLQHHYNILLDNNNNNNNNNNQNYNTIYIYSNNTSNNSIYPYINTFLIMGIIIMIVPALDPNPIPNPIRRIRTSETDIINQKTGRPGTFALT